MKKSNYLIKNIRYLRLKNNLTYQHLADDLMIFVSLYKAWEDYRSEPQTEHLKRLSQYFKVSIDYLCLADLKKLTENEILENYYYIQARLEFKKKK